MTHNLIYTYPNTISEGSSCANNKNDLHVDSSGETILNYRDNVLFGFVNELELIKTLPHFVAFGT